MNLFRFAALILTLTGQFAHAEELMATCKPYDGAAIEVMIHKADDSGFYVMRDFPLDTVYPYEAPSDHLRRTRMAVSADKLKLSEVDENGQIKADGMVLEIKSTTLGTYGYNSLLSGFRHFGHPSPFIQDGDLENPIKMTCMGFSWNEPKLVR